MTIDVNIVDPKTLIAAGVNRFGQLAAAPLDFSTPSAQTIDAINTAFNFISPRPDQSIIITNIFAIAGKTAPVGGSIVQVYEASSATDIVIDELILPLDIPRQVPVNLGNLNLEVPPGKFVNVQSDGQPILVSILFYRAPIKEVST